MTSGSRVGRVRWEGGGLGLPVVRFLSLWVMEAEGKQHIPIGPDSDLGQATSV